MNAYGMNNKMAYPNPKPNPLRIIIIETMNGIFDARHALTQSETNLMLKNEKENFFNVFPVPHFVTQQDVWNILFQAKDSINAWNIFMQKYGVSYAFM